MPKRRSNGIGAGRFEPSVRQLAHELNSLLDGSMRYIRIAQQALEDPAAGESTAAIIDRLDTAHQSLRDMAVLLERAMRGEAIFGDDPRDLAEQTRQIIAACSAMAEQAGVTLDLHIADRVASLPTGPLGPIILNGVRNAIEACATSLDSRYRHVEVSIGLNGRNQVEVIIADTGPGAGSDTWGTKPGGNGIGLDLCRRLADQVGGSVELMNVPFGGGAVLRVLIPISRLQRQ